MVRFNKIYCTRFSAFDVFTKLKSLFGIEMNLKKKNTIKFLNVYK